MNKTTYIPLLFWLLSKSIFAQFVDEPFPTKKMKKDLDVFKEILVKANSGLYKYRTKKQIDSIYNWAENQINRSSTYLDFYNIICQLTDFEGSCHNGIDLPEKYLESLRKESYGYFPYPIKWIDGKWIINYANGEIPLGSEIIEINGNPISKVILNLYKYYTTDGQNVTGKRIGMRKHFSKYYRLNYGKIKEFQITFKNRNSNKNEIKTLNSLSYSGYYKNFNDRYSKPYDQTYYTDLKQPQKYKYKKIDFSTGVLTIHSFDMGSEKTQGHQTYITFLDSIFTKIKTENLKNLIVDIRFNGGGTDPNDLVTYSYLTQRNFQENTQAWISFKKIPFIKHYDINIPKFLRPFVVGKFNKEFQKIFPLHKNDGYYQDENSDDHKIRTPNKNAFTGKIYLLINPEIASAGSLFASMVTGNKNTVTVGEETMGGYYGHNGHSSLDYKLPKSEIEFYFSVVNLEQDVPKKINQFYNRGIIPDYEVSQTLDDFLKNKDTQMEFLLNLIKQTE